MTRVVDPAGPGPAGRPRPPAGGWMLAATALLVVVTAGCGAGGTASASAQAALQTLPPCATAEAVELDASFAGVPLPAGARVTANQAPAGGGSGVVLAAPMTIAELGAFLEASFPAAGFTLGDGEAEPSELEQRFTGNGLAGQVTARYDSACDGVVTINIVVRST